MQIQSCKHCGVILDADVLPFDNTGDPYNGDGSVNTSKYVYCTEQDEWKPVCLCPVCNNTVVKGET